MALVPTNESKEKILKYEELLSKIRDLMRSVSKILDHYDKNYMKIKFDLDDDLLLNKTLEIPNVTILAVRAIFYENNKYYPQVFIDECLHEL